MADATARREARRRKVLLSSEERLQKIKLLNDKMKDVSDGAVADETQTRNTEANVDAATVKRSLRAAPIRSEDALEGERHTAALPLEESQGDRSPRMDTEGSTSAGLPVQSSEPLGNDDSSEDLIRKSRTDVEECKDKTDPDDSTPETHPTATKVPESYKSDQEIMEDTLARGCHSGDSTHGKPPSPLHSQHASGKTPVTCQLQSEAHSHRVSNDISPSSISTPPSVPQPKAPAPITTQVSTPTVAAGHILTMRELSVVFVAVMMRLMLAVDWLTSLSGQSVIVPFIMLQVTLFYLQSQKQQMVGGMMVKVLSFAAMVSKVPQASVNKFRFWISTVSVFFEDLALYLFVFVITHGVLKLLT